MRYLLFHTLTTRFLVVLCAVALAGCGSEPFGGDNTVAGIEGTGIVSGFGSVYIDGFEFATDNAVIRVNGQPATEADLRVGDVVAVRGRIQADGDAVARRIVFDRTLDGPIDSLRLADDGSGELRALGQRVRITADTHFINTEPGQLQPGALIAVSALAGADGNLRAGSIERGGAYNPGATRIDVEGRVRDLTDTAFHIGTQTVRYASATLAPSAQALREGAYVQVFGVRGPGTQAPLRADRVAVRSRAVGRAGAQVFIESIITDYHGLADFRLNGQRIDAADARRTDDAAIGPAAGVAAAVRGVLRDGVVRANTLRLEPVPDVMLSARLSGVDTRANRLTLLGTSARVRPSTLYIDASDAHERDLRIDTLAAGDTVAVSGYRTVDGQLIATRVTRTAAQAQGMARVRAPLTDSARDGLGATLRVGGVVIRARAGVTRFLGADGEPLSAAAFFDRLDPGTTIEADGPDNAGQIETARSLRITTAD